MTKKPAPNSTTSLKELEPFHFIGIGGSGMAPLAKLAHCRGLVVQGSDQKTNRVTRDLQERGIFVVHGHDAAAIGSARTIIHSTAVQKDNAEMRAASERGLTILHRSAFMHRLMQGCQPITVAGTHGKTTTTAMITHTLTALGVDPTAVVGGEIKSIGADFRHGEGLFFVAEADESDGSFLNYDPFVAVITNVESDHLDYYKTESAIHDAFRTYMEKIHREGWAVLGWNDPIVRQIAEGYSGRKLSFGSIIGSEVRAWSIDHEPGAVSFKAVVENDKVSCRIQMPGDHNVLNALCTLAVIRCLELPVVAAAEALETFEGVSRRMDLICESPGLKVIDDYAHNPGKIAAAVKSVQKSWPALPLRVVFQPHRYSRLRTMYSDFTQAFSGVREVIVTPVYSAGEAVDHSFEPETIARDIAAGSGVSAVAKSSLVDTINYLKQSLNQAQIILTVGAGDVNSVAFALKESVLGQERKFPS